MYVRSGTKSVTVIWVYGSVVRYKDIFVEILYVNSLTPNFMIFLYGRHIYNNGLYTGYLPIALEGCELLKLFRLTENVISQWTV